MHRIVFSLVALSSVLAAQEESSSQDESRLSSRWAALTVASIGVRYFGDSGTDPVAQFQHQELLGGEFRFDPEAKYTLQTLFASGAPFTTSWNGSSAHIYWKQFYFSAKPVKGVDFQVGGLGLEPTAFTDIITYSEDGYITGSRLSVHRPEELFFDTISATYGYLGDLNSPGMTDRFRRMDRVNFRQYLASKRVMESVVASVQYTDQWGIRTLHEGVKVSDLALGVIDSARVELYQRTNYGPARGFNAGVEKELHRLTLEGGYASIDPNFGDLNADNFLHGNRVYLGGKLRLAGGLRMFAMFNHGVNNDYALPNRSHLDIGFVYDILKALPKAPKS